MSDYEDKIKARKKWLRKQIKDLATERKFLLIEQREHRIELAELKEIETKQEL